MLEGKWGAVATTVDIEAASVVHGHVGQDVLSIRLNEYATALATEVAAQEGTFSPGFVWSMSSTHNSPAWMASRYLPIDSAMILSMLHKSGSVSLAESDQFLTSGSVPGKWRNRKLEIH